ncbi:hypothetical protein DTL70_06780 [Streptomyces diacarni]|uniref:Uncharacterized protein n=1 Tax=Streptomyces diacarni TaxID=2800381 RepID=A0A367F7G0_9ACTN|nr:hypothetical protein [Streptomyces diacarni]RCG26296.1 hypothetical protein DTL70_06780 [Streptomyces diacarni]
MDSGTAAVIGAAIGAIGGLSGGWLSALEQRNQRKEERRRWRDETRRDAYVADISATKRLAAAQWKLADCLWTEESTPEEWQVGFVADHEAWTEFSAAAAAVAVAGPASAAEAAHDLRTAMVEIQRAMMAWVAAAREVGHGRLDEFNQRFKAAAVAKRQPDLDFQIAARAALNTEC